MNPNPPILNSFSNEGMCGLFSSLLIAPVFACSGDHNLKPFVISTPDVTFTRRSSEDECLVLATDGLWDVMSTDTVAKFAINGLRAYRSAITCASTLAATVAEDLVQKALIIHSKDNITVTVVDLKPLWRSNRCS